MPSFAGGQTINNGNFDGIRCNGRPKVLVTFGVMLLDRFVDHLTYEKRYSAHTVAAYRRDLDQFQVFLNGFGIANPEQATDKVVRGWMMDLMEHGVGPRSVNRKLSALRSFFHFARMVGDITTEPTALIGPPKTPKRLPESVPEQGMLRLLEDVE